MMTGLSVLTLSAAFTPAYAQESGAVLEIENFIGRLTITNGERVSVKGEANGSLSQTDNLWHIDGGEEIEGASCRENNSRIELSIGSWSWIGRRGGYKNLNEYPHLKVTLPPHAHLKVSESCLLYTSPSPRDRG